ncbi:MAG: suppressor of fused domain protein [Archangium sp.]|nr:suppressor of fused domain protein [Archangium sp.]
MVRQERPKAGPVHELPEEFEVLVFRRQDTLSYATCCMSQPSDEERVELHLLTRVTQGFRAELVELMAAVAHYHRTGARLGLGHSVNFGRPWVEGATSSFGLISLPYLDGPSVEWMAEPAVRCLWLIPITEEEREFKKSRGGEALERRFEAAQFDYLDPFRGSVV